MDCNRAWYNVTKAFLRDTYRFRYYYAALDTELCLGLECPNCADNPTNGSQSSVYPIIKPAFSQKADSHSSLRVGSGSSCIQLADYYRERYHLAKGPNPLGWPDRRLALGDHS